MCALCNAYFIVNAFEDTKVFLWISLSNILIVCHIIALCEFVFLHSCMCCKIHAELSNVSIKTYIREYYKRVIILSTFWSSQQIPHTIHIHSFFVRHRYRSDLFQCFLTMHQGWIVSIWDKSRNSCIYTICIWLQF